MWCITCFLLFADVQSWKSLWGKLGMSAVWLRGLPPFPEVVTTRILGRWRTQGMIRCRSVEDHDIVTLIQCWNTWIFLLCVKCVPKFTQKTYQKGRTFKYSEDTGMNFSMNHQDPDFLADPMSVSFLYHVVWSKKSVCQTVCGNSSEKYCLTPRILQMSWGVKNTVFETLFGVSLGGSGVSIGGVKILRVMCFWFAIYRGSFLFGS